MDEQEEDGKITPYIYDFGRAVYECDECWKDTHKTIAMQSGFYCFDCIKESYRLVMDGTVEERNNESRNS